MPPPTKTTPREWIERFGIYFLGIAIGLVIVAAIQSARSRSITASQQSPPEIGVTARGTAKP